MELWRTPDACCLIIGEKCWFFGERRLVWHPLRCIFTVSVRGGFSSVFHGSSLFSQDLVAQCRLYFHLHLEAKNGLDSTEKLFTREMYAGYTRKLVHFALFLIPDALLGGESGNGIGERLGGTLRPLYKRDNSRLFGGIMHELKFTNPSVR